MPLGGMVLALVQKETFERYLGSWQMRVSVYAKNCLAHAGVCVLLRLLVQQAVRNYGEHHEDRPKDLGPAPSPLQYIHGPSLYK